MWWVATLYQSFLPRFSGVFGFLVGCWLGLLPWSFCLVPVVRVLVVLLVLVLVVVLVVLPVLVLLLLVLLLGVCLLARPRCWFGFGGASRWSLLGV